uniref:Large ribosomal subunit protein uL22c n=1 Tax=Euglena gracilis var. bacillaris TaxID=158060 RepID=A0A0G3VS78_EUGGR|nr:rpl22 [Euglena gracilis]AKL82369.1 ribosomal protein L22 [Euglena gracilis var. bacillaris]
MEQKKPLESSASIKYVRISPFKVRRILNQIKGRSAKEALMILKFMPYKPSTLIFKLLKSAVSNSIKNYDEDANVLRVLEARADAGPILKRLCPHAQGRGFPIKKRTCHITIIV